MTHIEMRRSLDEIGLATGTDKASDCHDYLHTYEREFRHLRDQPFTLIEIGVHKGASVRMWERYFPYAQIIGVDINRQCKQFESGQVSIRILDQGDSRKMALLGYAKKPTIVIDDGSHRWSHQIDTFRAMWPTVVHGGFYVIEDIHTSFGDDYAKTYGDGDVSAYDYVAALIRNLAASERAESYADEFEKAFRQDVDYVITLRHSVIFRKKERDR